MKTPPAPKEWSVRNGTFVGHTLVSREPDGSGVRMGMAQTREDWIPYAIDLRVIDAIKPYGFDDLHLTSLYHHGTFVGCVNAPFSGILEPWLNTRHLFDNVREDADCIDPQPPVVL